MQPADLLGREQIGGLCYTQTLSDQAADQGVSRSLRGRLIDILI
jgi:hypothetical protein